MSQAELLWGAFSLMLLGALLTMCMKCQRTGSKPDKSSFYGQADPYVSAGCGAQAIGEREWQPAHAQMHPWPLSYEDQPRLKNPHAYSTSRQEYLNTPNATRGPSKSNEPHSVPKQLEMPTDPEIAYIEPISNAHYWNSRDLLRSSRDEESPTYQNMPGPSRSNMCDVAVVEIYENSRVFQVWKDSRIPGKPYDDDDDDEPEYINADMQSRTAP